MTSPSATQTNQDNQVEVQPIALQTIPQNTAEGKSLINGNLKLVGNVKVKVRAVIGDAELTVSELFALKENSSIKLDTLANAPIDLYLEGKLIAKGDLVVVDDSFGIKITEIQAENVSS
jgi:flagellar motor switch protein FliN/FliY